MRRILLTTATLGALTLGAAGAMAQTAAPVPNASGSQVTNPNTYGATVPQNQGAAQAIPAAPGMTGEDRFDQARQRAEVHQGNDGRQ